MSQPLVSSVDSGALIEAMPCPMTAERTEPPEQDLIEAYRLLDEAVDAFNCADPERMAAVNHYPHIRITGPQVVIWNTPEEYAQSNSREKLLSKDRTTTFSGWKTSQWEWRKLIQHSPETMHFAVAFSRLDADGNKLAMFESFRILTKKNGRWGQQARSSFAGIADGGSY